MYLIVHLHTFMFSCVVTSTLVPIVRYKCTVVANCTGIWEPRKGTWTSTFEHFAVHAFLPPFTFASCMALPRRAIRPAASSTCLSSSHLVVNMHEVHNPCTSSTSRPCLPHGKRIAKSASRESRLLNKPSDLQEKNTCTPSVPRNLPRTWRTPAALSRSHVKRRFPRSCVKVTQS